MTRIWRLTLQAEESLFEISRWTLETFGPQQAEAYAEDLIKCCAAIAAGEVLAQSCRTLIDPALPESLRFVRSGMHLVIFTATDADIVVVDFLHRQFDLPRRLHTLSDPEQKP